MVKSRSEKGLLNAKIGMVFYVLTLALSFFSRKIFLDELGAEFIGLTGALLNIMNFLNLAEFGLNTSVSYFLYKPLKTGSKDHICELISLFGYVYERIGRYMIIAGILVSLFFPLLFSKNNLSSGIVFFSFYIFLFSSLVGYFINYRQILLNADQKNYIVAAYCQIGMILKTLVQIFIAYKYQNLYVWISLEAVFTIAYSLVLEKKIKKEYAWLEVSSLTGKELIQKYQEVFAYTKQIFIHKLKDFLLNRSDEILIFVFVSLKMVAYYGNYILLITKVNQLLNVMLNGINAGIGSLVAEGDHVKVAKVFWEFMSLRYYIVGIVIFSFYHFASAFIVLWLGEEYVLSTVVLLLILVSVFIAQTYWTIEVFNAAYGLYADVWAAWTEVIINVTITIVAAHFYGLPGILIGKILGSFPIAVFWKPYYLFSKGFKLSYKSYWVKTIRYYAVFLISFLLFYIIIDKIQYDLTKSFLNFIAFAFSSIFAFSLFYLILLIGVCPGMKDFLRRFPVTSVLLSRFRL